MAMTSYPADPSAIAVVLFDKGEYSHIYSSNEGFLFEFERHVRIKIFKKEAYKYADVRILHFKSERISDLKACSYQVENGKLVETPLEKENTFDENLTSRLMVKKLTIPAVKEGSIIEYKYTIKDVNLPDWVFQRLEIPTIWSEFKASVPSFVEFKKMSQGWVPFTLAEEQEDDLNAGTTLTYTATRMHFIQENIPALKPEAFVLSPSDYLSQINFDVTTIYSIKAVPLGLGNKYKLINQAPKEINNTWQNLGRELLEEAYSAPLESSKYTEEDVQACTANQNTNAEKIASIYAFVGKNYQANDNDFIWQTEKIETIAKNKKGSPSDINLILINMLRKAKINAYPLVISTRQNGRVLPYRVSADAFNRVITAIENEDKSFTVIDATAWPHPIGLLPEEDLNNEGLLLKERNFIDWLPLQNKVPVRSALQGDLTIGQDGLLSGALSFSENGYGALEARGKIRETNATTYLQEKFPDLLAEGAIANIKIENLDQWQEPGIKGSLELQNASFITVSGDKMYITPSLGFGLKENPFKNPQRQFDIQLGTPNSKVYNMVLKLPAGYKVEEAPKSAKMVFGENALVFDYFMETTPETIKITIRQSVKQPYIAVEHYADLQQFYANMVAKLEEQLVLTKSNP